MSRSILGMVELATALAADNGTVHSDSIRFEECAGDATVLLISTAGSITVSQQCSLDNVTWYDPVNASASALGTVGTAVTVTTGTYIAYTVVLAPFIRYKIVEDGTGATAVTIKLQYRFER